MASCAHRDSFGSNRRSPGVALRGPHEVTLKHPGGREPPTARPPGEKHSYSLWRLVCSENCVALHILAIYRCISQYLRVLKRVSICVTLAFC